MNKHAMTKHAMTKHERWLRWMAVLLLLSAFVAIGLIATGVFDPRPMGTQKWQQPLVAESIPANSRRLLWLTQPLPHQPYSVRLTAAYQRGEVDIGYGLVLGNETAYLAVAVSPLGYVAIWQENSQHYPSTFCLLPSAFCLPSSSFILPWQPWPHVQGNAGANELWIDVAGEEDSETGPINVRINRELLWRGELNTLDGQIGLLVESFGDAAVIDFQCLELFTAARS